MLVMPSLDMVRRNTTVRIDPLIEATPALRDLVSAPRSRDAGNSLFRKSFPGGQLVMTGANSAVGLRSTPVRYLFRTRWTAIPAMPMARAIPSIWRSSAPPPSGAAQDLHGVHAHPEGPFRIEAAFLDSDQRYFHVPCQHCGDMALITWARIRWPEGQRDAAYLVCDACGGVHHEHDKPRLLAAGEWRPTAPGDGRTAGFHLSSLYSRGRHGPRSRRKHARVAKRSRPPAGLGQHQAGRVLGGPGGRHRPRRSADGRREDWGSDLAPAWPVLTAGVDVQGDRIEVQDRRLGP